MAGLAVSCTEIDRARDQTNPLSRIELIAGLQARYLVITPIAPSAGSTTPLNSLRPLPLTPCYYCPLLPATTAPYLLLVLQAGMLFGLSALLPVTTAPDTLSLLPLTGGYALRPVCVTPCYYCP